MTSTPTDLLGRSLGPYRLERLLGQGGFAWVFVGQDRAGTQVAVKVLKPRYAGDPQFEPRFRHESETASTLAHPNIVRIGPIAREGDHVYFTMDLCADSLGDRIARDGPLPETDIVRIAQDVARGLGYAHAQGIIHRDIKPGNVLLRADGSAVLTDFGIARAVSNYAASTGINMTIGTPHYLSPEQAQGRALDHRSDFYSLGVTLFKAALGDVPFTSADWFELARMHVEEPPPALRKRRPELSGRFERIVMKCLAKHPDDRYRDADELLADLAEVDERLRPSADVGRAPVTTTRPAVRVKPARTLRWLAIVAALAAVAAAVAVGLRTLR
ncbi:MAG: serine/threonine protein kinase [Candidatus Krumholzibacteria bacterium]|nr:serine/threonine protein kinase [Candidatus Krumholzibacteria bacterium]